MGKTQTWGLRGAVGRPNKNLRRPSGAATGHVQAKLERDQIALPGFAASRLREGTRKDKRARSFSTTGRLSCASGEGGESGCHSVNTMLVCLPK